MSEIIKCFRCGGYIPDYIIAMDRSDCKYHKKYPKLNIDDAIQEQINIRKDD
jgi:hypothetical protein